jgi:hypothetical protein
VSDSSRNKSALIKVIFGGFFHPTIGPNQGQKCQEGKTVHNYFLWQATCQTKAHYYNSILVFLEELAF